MRPNIGDIVRHSNGKYYRALMYCKHGGNGDVMIVYEALVSKGVEVLPLSIFLKDDFRVVIRAEDL